MNKYSRENVQFALILVTSTFSSSMLCYFAIQLPLFYINYRYAPHLYNYIFPTNDNGPNNEVLQ